MATNNIKPFATASNANVLSDEDLAACSELAVGFASKSKASSSLVGKLIQNATAGSYAVGEFTAKYGSRDVSGANAAGFATSFEGALEAYVGQKAPVVDVMRIVLSSTPGWYKRESLPSSNKTTVTIHSNTQVNVNGQGYISTSDVTLDVSTVGNADARAGKDIYIYACVPTSGTEPVFVLSMNSTVPDGYTATNSRKIGGFHCLCVDAGTIEGNAASGYTKGDIIPPSIWDLNHRALSENEGMVYIAELGLWCDIYLASWSGSNLQSVAYEEIVDGFSTKSMSGEMFAEEAGKVKKRLISRDEFLVIADSGNQMTNISGSADPGTTGGHIDTAGRRILTKDFVEDAAGVLWQWTTDIYGDSNNATTSGISSTSQTSTSEGNHYVENYTWQTDGRGTANINVDGAMNVKGRAFGALIRSIVGGNWDSSVGCGSRSVFLSNLSSSRGGSIGCRCVSSPRTPIQ